MNSFRAFTFLTFATLLGACGEGLPETPEQPAPQQQGESQVPDEAQGQNDEPDVHALATYDFIYPQETKTFATNWFTRTPVNVNNTSGAHVQFHIWCARYSWDKWVTLAPGETWSWGMPCEGTTLYIHNDATLGSGYSLYVTVNN